MLFEKFKSHLATLAGALVLTVVVMTNDLIFNLWNMYQRLSDSRVMQSVSKDVDRAIRDLAPEVLGMLALVAALTFIAALVWVAVSRVTCRTLVKSQGNGRQLRLAFWFFNIVAFFSLIYGAHGLLFPQDPLAQSPLALAFGLVDTQQLLLSSGLWLLGLSTLVALTTFGVAIHSSRPTRIAITIGAIGLTMLFGGYAWLTRPGTPTQFNQKGNIILLGMDSLQYNRLPVGGSPVDYAPNVNAFFEQSYQFANAWTPFARTFPSWLSILTGREPIHHGMRYNLMPDSHLAPDNHYLAALLREKGYATFHAMDGVRFCNIRPIHGYDRLFNPRMGIEDFFIGDFFDFTVANLVRQTALGDDLFPAIRNNNAASAFNPKLFTRALLCEMNRLPQDQPLFISMHLSADHWPFRTPAPYCYGSINPVENCIRMVDDQMGEIIDYLHQSGLWDNSTVFLLSDHGDGWTGDPADMITTHGEHFNKLWANRIILAMHRPDNRTGCSYEFVKTMDLYPTVLELAGLTPPADIDGYSLLPLMRGKAMPSQPFFAETGLARNAFSAADLARRNLSFYTYDPESWRVTIKESSYDGLLESKYYMMIDDGWLLWMRPRSRKFAIRPFDGNMARIDGPPEDCPVSVRRRMLKTLSEHFGLDTYGLLTMANREGFLDAGKSMLAYDPSG